jgi:hypothetical protein
MRAAAAAAAAATAVLLPRVTPGVTILTDSMAAYV